MQPIDVARDKRPPFKKIANSIRAAILTGEFEPGAQLPPGRELAEFFSLPAPMTVHQAIRVLRDEGFVISRAGSGVFVASSRLHAEPEDAAHHFRCRRLPPRDRPAQASSARRLALRRRPDPEVVAEHTFRDAIVGIALATLEGADPGRTAALCLLHDSPETRIGDIPAVGRAYMTPPHPRLSAPIRPPPCRTASPRCSRGSSRLRGRRLDRVPPRPRRRQDRNPAAGPRVRGRRPARRRPDGRTPAPRAPHRRRQAARRPILATTPAAWWSALAGPTPRCAGRPAARAIPALVPRRRGSRIAPGAAPTLWSRPPRTRQIVAPFQRTEQRRLTMRLLTPCPGRATYRRPRRHLT